MQENADDPKRNISQRMFENWFKDPVYLLECVNDGCGLKLPSRIPQYCTQCPRCGSPLACRQER